MDLKSVLSGPTVGYYSQEVPLSESRIEGSDSVRSLFP